MSIDAERIAEALKPSGGRVARRNRLIKKALVAEFGNGNVSVKGDRGTEHETKEKVKVSCVQPTVG